MVVGLGGVAEEREGVGAGGEGLDEVEAERAASGAFGEAGNEGSLGCGPVRAGAGEESFDLLGGQRAEPDDTAAGADRRQELSGVFGEEDEVGVVGWLFEELEEGVGRFLHERGGGDDEDQAGGLGGAALGAVDHSADLAELDEELRRVGGDDEDVGMRLDEDAGVLFVGLAHVFAGGDGFVDFGLEVGGFGDAGAVSADAAEGGEFAAVDCFAGLALAFEGHREHQREGVFARATGAGDDERVRQAAGGDRGTEVVDGGGVAEEVREGGGERHLLSGYRSGVGGDVDCGFGGVHGGGPPPRGYFVRQNLDETGLRFFGVYPLGAC